MTHNYCPKCDGIPLLDIQDDLENIKIQCECGYYNTFTINTYLSLLSNIKPSPSFELNQAKDHLDHYFSSLKNSFIHPLIQQINKVESFYQKCFKINKKILSLLELLNEGYKDFQYQLNIINYRNNINDMNNLIQYFNDYQLINLLTHQLFFDSVKFTEIKQYPDYGCNVSCLLLLQDGRIAISLLNNTIQIIDPNNNYQIDINNKGEKYIASVKQVYSK